MLSTRHRDLLHQVARLSVESGLNQGTALDCSVNDYPQVLRQPAACFVTLHYQTRLRGCIGSLEARRPLVDDVSHNAFAAAFQDRRFSPVTADELPDLDYHIAVLSSRQPLAYANRDDLLAQLRPGVDGLVLSSGGHRGTFLPAVWDHLPSAERFLGELVVKAGLPRDYWSNDIRIERYQVEDF